MDKWWATYIHHFTTVFWVQACSVLWRIIQNGRNCPRGTGDEHDTNMDLFLIRDDKREIRNEPFLMVLCSIHVTHHFPSITSSAAGLQNVRDFVRLQFIFDSTWFFHDECQTIGPQSDTSNASASLQRRSDDLTTSVREKIIHVGGSRQIVAQSFGWHRSNWFTHTSSLFCALPEQ